MYITANLLFRDTINFLKSKWTIIIVFVLLSSSITLIIDSAITPDIKSLLTFHQSNIKKYYSLLDFVRTLTLDQQKVLLISSITRSFALLVGNSLLLGNLITFIQHVSYKKDIVSLSILNNIPLKLFLKLMQLIFITTFITQLGFLLFVIPGIIFLILFSLSPIVLIIENKTVLDSIYFSINKTLLNFKIIVPAVTLWIFLKFFIILFISHIKIFSEHVEFFLLNSCINLITSILTLYLFRFYMLSSKS